MQNSSKGIEQEAIARLKELLTDFEVTSTARDTRISGFEADLLITIRRKNSQKTRKLVCEIKAIVEPRHAFELTSKLRYIAASVNAFPMLIALKIGKKGMEICRSNEVGYLDMVGNVFLKFDNLLIDRQVEPQVEQGQDSTKALFGSASKDLPANFMVRRHKLVKNIFAPLSSRIIRILLADLKPRKVEELASLSNASRIYVYKVIKSLEVKGFVSRDEQHRVRIDKPGDLLNQWSNQYNFAANRVESYYSPEQDPSKIMRLVGQRLNQGYALTLHAGASLIAPYVRFSDVHLYIINSELKQSAVNALDLRPTEFGGNVHLIEPFDESIFYGIQQIKSLKVVSNIQLYLDLYNYPSRGREQAEFLREKVLRY